MLAGVARRDVSWYCHAARGMKGTNLAHGRAHRDIWCGKCDVFDTLARPFLFSFHAWAGYKTRKVYINSTHIHRVINESHIVFAHDIAKKNRPT